MSATYVVLFILFGSFVERSGAGKLFMDFALGLTGGTAGGPAKVAVLTSALFGSVLISIFSAVGSNFIGPSGHIEVIVRRD